MCLDKLPSVEQEIARYEGDNGNSGSVAWYIVDELSQCWHFVQEFARILTGV